jgi:hypothetical protein
MAPISVVVVLWPLVPVIAAKGMTRNKRQFNFAQYRNGALNRSLAAKH